MRMSWSSTWERSAEFWLGQAAWRRRREAAENLPHDATPLGGKADLGNSRCRRTLCADGTVSESIVLATGNNGREITGAELEAWVESFPIDGPGVMRVRRLPLPE